MKKDKDLPGLIMINGLYRHGFMIAPAVLDCALQVLDHGISKTAFELSLSIIQDNHLSEELCV